MGYNCYNHSANCSQRPCGCPERTHSDMPGKSLAMTYVPWQCWKDIYDYDKGFCVGSIFAELNKPFEGGRR